MLNDPVRIGIACAAVAAALLWRVWQVGVLAWRQWRYLKHLPAPPATHWLLGNVPDFLSTEAPMRLAGYVKQCGGVFRIRFFYLFGVIVTDPPVVRAILQSSKTYVPKNRLLLKSLELASGQPALPNIVTSSDGDYWRLLRGAWMKCFTSTNLKRVLPIVQDICDRVIQQIKQQAAAASNADTAAPAAPAPAATPVAAPPEGATAAVKAAEAAGELAKPPAAAAPAAVTAANVAVSSSQVPAGSAVVNICNVTDRITLDVIGHVSYGRDFGAVDHKRSRYLELVSGMLALMHEEMDHPLRRLLRRLNLFSTSNKNKALLRAEWDAANTAEVMRAVAEPPGEHTIAGQLMLLRDPVTNTPLSPQQLRSEMVIATLAGFETTSNALSWTLAALATHPQAMATLEQELAAAGLLATPQNPDPASFEWQVLGKLSYLQACIREGLRLFPPAAQGSFRLCTTADIHINKQLTLPKNTVVGVPFFAFGHNPATYGPDVEDFKPERWLLGRPPPTAVTSSSSSSSTTNMSSSMDMNMHTSSTDDALAGATGSTQSSDTAAAAATGGKAVAGEERNSSMKQLQDPWTFSIGPRDCAGQALARLELQVVIAKIVGAFRVQVAPEVGGWEGLLERRMFHTTLQVRDGLPLLLTPRV